MKLSVILAIALVPAFASNSAAQESRRYINPSSVADSTALPFSGGVLVGISQQADTIYELRLLSLLKLP